MKIFVTGGAGFIGSNFIRYWVKRHPEDEVVNFDALTYAGNLENLSDIASHPRYSFVKGDVADKEAVSRAIIGSEAVVHFAAETHVDRSIQDARQFIRTNVNGTHTLLEASREAGIKKFVQVSTDEVFGDLALDSVQKFDENSPYRPRSPYAASKAAADLLVDAYVNTYGFPAQILHPANNFGPYQFPEKFIPLMIINGIQRIPLPIYGSGENIRSWLYVEDTVEAIERIIYQGKTGEHWCLDGEERNNLGVARKILEILGGDGKLITHVPDRPGHDLRYALDSSKIRRELGWKACLSFEERLAETIEWYRRNENWWRRSLDRQRSYFKNQYPTIHA